MMLALTPKEEEKEEQEQQHTGPSGEVFSRYLGTGQMGGWRRAASSMGLQCLPYTTSISYRYHKGCLSVSQYSISNPPASKPLACSPAQL